MPQASKRGNAAMPSELCDFPQARKVYGLRIQTAILFSDDRAALPQEPDKYDRTSTYMLLWEKHASKSFKDGSFPRNPLTEPKVLYLGHDADNFAKDADKHVPVWKSEITERILDVTLN